MPDDRIEVDVLYGATEVLGTDRHAGIQPTRPQISADEWGPASMDFQIPRLPTLDNRDLLPETPIRYYRDDELIFGGRITDAIRSDQEGTHQVTVTCQGWQFALDDDVFYEAWILGRLDPWADLKNAVVVDMNAADPLGLYELEGPCSAGDVQITSGNRGSISLGLTAGQTIGHRQKIGVWMDAKAYPSFQHVWIELFRSLGAASGTSMHLVFAGAPTPHFLSTSRVEYWNLALNELDAHHKQYIDPIVGLAPMPYMGIFIEIPPPPPPVPVPPQTIETYIYGEREVTGSDIAGHAGPVTIHDVGAVEGDLLIAIVSMTGSAAAQNDSGVYASNTLWAQPNVALLNDGDVPGSDGGITRCETWAATVFGVWDPETATNVIPFDHTFTIREDTGGYNLSVHYFRLRNSDGPAWGHLPFTDTVQVSSHIPEGGYMEVAHVLQPQGPGAIFMSIGFSTAGEMPAFGWPTSDEGPPATEFEEQTVHSRAMPPLAPGQPTYGVYISIDDRNDAHTTAESPVSFIYGFEDEAPTLATSRGLVFEQTLPGTPIENVFETPGSDIRILIDTLRMAPIEGYLGPSGVSELKVGRVAADAVALCPQLDHDESGVDLVGGPSLDSFVADGQTPREIIDAANAIRAARVRVGADRRLLLDSYPTTPAWQVSQAGTQLDGGGASSGGMANATLVTGTDALGRPYLAKRGAYYALGGSATLVPQSQADVGAGATQWWDFSHAPPAGWDGALIGAKRMVGTSWVLSTDPPGARGEAQAAGYIKLGESFQVGREYLLKLRAHVSADTSTEGVPRFARIFFYGRNYRILSRETQIIAPDTSPADYYLDFVAVDPWMHIYIVAGVASISDTELDAISLQSIDLSYVSDATLLDRRGVRRTLAVQIDGEATQGKGLALSSAQLSDASRVNFQGSLVCDAWSIQPIGGGAPIENATMIGKVGDMIRMLDELDPITMAPGRDARIVGASFDASTGQVTLELDATRHDLERVQARLAVLP